MFILKFIQCLSDNKCPDSGPDLDPAPEVNADP
jgi:hypothetical protein